MAITTVLLDLDGVIRHFDPTHRPAVEAAYGLAPDSIAPVAMASPLIDELITGRRTFAEWTAIVGERIGSPEAAAAWVANRGAADPEMLRVCDRLRAAGYTVAVLTNGSDRSATEVVDLGIAPHIDRLFSTWDIGYAKPNPRAFQHCCDALGVHPSEVFFTDDTETKLAGAVELGMTARHFMDVATFEGQLRELSIG